MLFLQELTFQINLLIEISNIPSWWLPFPGFCSLQLLHKITSKLLPSKLITTNIHHTIDAMYKINLTIQHKKDTVNIMTGYLLKKENQTSKVNIFKSQTYHFHKNVIILTHNGKKVYLEMTKKAKSLDEPTFESIGSFKF